MIADDKKRVTLTLSTENAEKLAKLAKKVGLSKSALVTMWVNANENK